VLGDPGAEVLGGGDVGLGDGFGRASTGDWAAAPVKKPSRFRSFSQPVVEAQPG